MELQVPLRELRLGCIPSSSRSGKVAGPLCIVIKRFSYRPGFCVDTQSFQELFEKGSRQAAHPKTVHGKDVRKDSSRRHKLGFSRETEPIAGDAGES